MFFRNILIQRFGAENSQLIENLLDENSHLLKDKKNIQVISKEIIQ